MEIRLDGSQPATKKPRYLRLREVLVETEDDDSTLAEGEPTDNTPGLVEVRVLDKARDRRRLAAPYSKTTKVAPTEIDHGGSEISVGILQGSSGSGNPDKGLLHQFLGVRGGTDK